MVQNIKYADLMNDDVFKLVFGQESSKDVMIEFLNQVITDRTITDLEFIDKEMHQIEQNRKSCVYDMFCKTDDGTRVIVEVQRRKQPFFPERALYYSTFQIQRQVDSGAEEYDFLPVYVISLLDFNLDRNEGCSEVRTVYRLYEESSHRLMTDRINFIFLEMGKFNKTIDEIDPSDILEGMYFCLKNMAKLQDRPESLKHEVFGKIFKISELYNMDEETRNKVLDNMTTERDLRNQMAYARKEGLEQGLEQGKVEAARNLKALEVDLETIAKGTGLSLEQIEAL